MPISTLCFDLDGTLTNPKDGILNCIRYALKPLDGVIPTEPELQAYIGPPLTDGFAELLETNDEALIEKVVALYRERYSVKGLYENEIYLQIPKTLHHFRQQTFTCFVVTAKPRIYATKIVEHFEIHQLFEEVYGPELDGRLDDKPELIEHILNTSSIKPDETVMIGDRKHDIHAGKSNGLKTVGVTYGFGTAQELTEAGANLIYNTPEELVEIPEKLSY